MRLGAGSKAPAQLSQGTKDWVAAKRLDVKDLMWANAGILRRTKDMTATLQRLNALSFEAQASQPYPRCSINYLRLLPSWTCRSGRLRSLDLRLPRLMCTDGHRC